MNAIERAGRAARQAGPAAERAGNAADAFQQRWPALAFPVAVWKKFSDDQAGNLAALIAYYGFTAIFPLLLVLATILNIVLKSNPALQKTLTDSALAQYPVIGQQIKTQLGAIPGTGLPLIFGAIFLLFGARGVANAMQNALCEVWGIPRRNRPGMGKITYPPQIMDSGRSFPYTGTIAPCPMAGRGPRAGLSAGPGLIN